MQIQVTKGMATSTVTCSDRVALDLVPALKEIGYICRFHQAKERGNRVSETEKQELAELLSK